MAHTGISLSQSVGMWVLGPSTLLKDELFTQLLAADWRTCMWWEDFYIHSSTSLSCL